MRIVFMGTPQAAVPSLERLLRDQHEIVAVYTQPDRPAGRGNKITFSPIKEFAKANNLAIFQPLKIKTPETFEVFKSHKADVTVVVAYGRILPGTFLNAFPNGAINVHFSLLPMYRGAAPVNWAIVNGEMETGVTTMQMDAGLDTGAILMQKAVQIVGSETSVVLMDRLAVVGADLLSETLANLDGIKPIEQDHDRATIAPIMKREDGLIDWEMSAQMISRRVRGFQPFPTAFTHLEQNRLTIWRACTLDGNEGSVSKAGEIIAAHGDDLLIGCGDGSILKIDELQPEGKRRMAVRDFLNGFKPRIGAKFGD